MKYLTVVVDDRVGLIADISYILSKAKINIESIHVETIGGKAIITLGVLDVKKTAKILKNSGYSSTEEDAIVLKLIDQPGELNRISEKLAEHKVNIRNVHMLSRDKKYTVIAMIVNKPKTARKLLKDYIINAS